MRNDKARVPDPNEFVTCPGETEHIVYTSKVMEDGTILLTPCGKENIKELINSYVDQTDISYIMAQLAVGNTSVLNNKTPMYGDFTEAPKDLRHAMQIMLDGEKAFYQLDLDTRQKFNNDFRQWLVTAGSESWLKNMGAAPSDPESAQEKTNESEVKE